MAGDGEDASRLSLATAIFYFYTRLSSDLCSPPSCPSHSSFLSKHGNKKVPAHLASQLGERTLARTPPTHVERG